MDLNQLLDINLQMEGCIRILINRPCDEAERHLFELNNKFNDLLKEEHKDIPEKNEIIQDDNEKIQDDNETIQDDNETIQNDNPIVQENITELIKGEENLNDIALQQSPTRIEDTLSPKDEYRVENMIAQKESRDFARAITLNDRYRFTRALFEGDKELFDSTIKKIEGMESLSEAYEYFLCELNWDADQTEASDFLTLVANHFNSAE